MQSTLELKQVSYYYFSGTTVLDQIDAVFETGKLYVIFGPSGCGKTTLLALLGGLDSPKSGAIYVNGENIAEYGLQNHRKHHVSFVFQNYNLIDYMTSEENVLLTSKQDAKQILEQLGISSEEAKRNVLQLSGGQQQRVAIARALASDNPIILADEPTGNLDGRTAEEITRIFRDAAKVYGKCVIIVSHSNEVAKQADTVYELKDGKLQEKSFQLAKA